MLIVPSNNEPDEFSEEDQQDLSNIMAKLRDSDTETVVDDEDDDDVDMSSIRAGFGKVPVTIIDDRDLTDGSDLTPEQELTMSEVMDQFLAEGEASGKFKVLRGKEAEEAMRSASRYGCRF